MHYERAGTVSAVRQPLSPDETSTRQVVDGGHADAHVVDAFWESISLQAAARTARRGTGAPAISKEAAAALHTIGAQHEKRDLAPSFNLVMASTIGVIVFACFAYFITGGALLLRQ
jgi:hypothetical protein